VDRRASGISTKWRRRRPWLYVAFSHLCFPFTTNRHGSIVAADLLFEDMQATNLRSAPFTISQCTTYSGTEGNCTSSKFEIYDISFKSIQGTTEGTTDVASFQCSAVKPCTNLVITDVDLVVASNGTNVNQYLCGNVENPEGWNCTGNVCVGSSATGGC
jgi:galacturan 1,4-alpha-galacturonidase